MALRTPVYELLGNMSFQEFILWLEFFDRRPIGWREDLRAYNVMCSGGNMKGRKPEDFFASIAAMREHERRRMPVAIPRSGSAAHKLLMGARGGAKLDFLENI